MHQTWLLYGSLAEHATIGYVFFCQAKPVYLAPTFPQGRRQRLEELEVGEQRRH